MLRPPGASSGSVADTVRAGFSVVQAGTVAAGTGALDSGSTQVTLRLVGRSRIFAGVPVRSHSSPVPVFIQLAEPTARRVPVGSQV